MISAPLATNAAIDHRTGPSTCFTIPNRAGCTFLRPPWPPGRPTDGGRTVAAGDLRRRPRPTCRRRLRRPTTTDGRPTSRQRQTPSLAGRGQPADPRAVSVRSQGPPGYQGASVPLSECALCVGGCMPVCIRRPEKWKSKYTKRLTQAFSTESIAYFTSDRQSSRGLSRHSR